MTDEKETIHIVSCMDYIAKIRWSAEDNLFVWRVSNKPNLIMGGHGETYAEAKEDFYASVEEFERGQIERPTFTIKKPE